MNINSRWTEVLNSPKIRTQVILTRLLKKIIDAQRKTTDESLSEYLRKAAYLRIVSEKAINQKLEGLANQLIGSVSLKSHPEWKTPRNLDRWLKNLRQEWEK
ncbi:MAG: hypothetical protein ABIB61_00595 [Candidatus Shapirobacteria bacterium]